MERFSIECRACNREVGSGTRIEAVPLAVAHLQQHHRAVTLPHPALDLIRLHPYYSIDALESATITPLAPEGAAISTGVSAQAKTPAAPGGLGEKIPPTADN